MGDNPSDLARAIRSTRQLGFDVVGVKADADFRHVWRNERFDAVVVREGIDADMRKVFLTEIRQLDPDLPVYDRDGSDEDMAGFLDGVVQELGG